MSPQTPAGTPDPVDVATTVATPLPEVGTPLPQVKVQPIDPGLAASQVAADRRIAQREAGVKDVPGVGESPTANPPEVVARKPRTPAEIEADMNATRERLTATLTQLQDTVQETFAPRNIMHRQLEKVRGYYIDEYGAVRPERVAKTVGAVVAVVVVVKVTRKVFS